MSQGDFYSDTAQGIASGNEWSPDISTSATGAVEIHSFGTTRGVRIVKEIDIDDDGTYEVTIELLDKAGQLHSQNNKVEINSSNMRLRFVNTSDSANDFHVSGMEVAN